MSAISSLVSTQRGPNRAPASQIVLLILTIAVGVIAEAIIGYNFYLLSQATDNAALATQLLPQLSAVQREVFNLHAQTEGELASDIPKFDQLEASRASLDGRLERLEQLAAGKEIYAPAMEAVRTLLQVYDTEIANLQEGASVETVRFELDRAFDDAETKLSEIYLPEENAFFQATNTSFTTSRFSQFILLAAGLFIFVLALTLILVTRRAVQHELGRAAGRLQVAAEVGRAASSLLSVDELFDTALNLIRERFGIYHASIFLLDESGKHAVLRAASGDVGRQLVASHYKLEVGSKSIIGFVSANNQARTASDTARDPNYFQSELLPNTRSELAVPLRQSGQVIGVLDVQSIDSEAFTEEDASVMQTLADQLAVAIGNAAQYTKEKARAQQLAALTDAAVELGIPQVNFEALLELIARRALRLLNSDGVGVWLVADKDELELRVTHEAGSTQHEAMERVTAHDTQWPLAMQRLRRGQGLAGQVYATGRALRVDNYLQWSGQTFEQANLRSALSVPMTWQGNVVGVLSFSHSQESHFTPDDERYAQLFASQAAAAIENTRLLQETQSRMGELFTLNQISQAVTAQTDLPGLFDAVRQEVLQAIKAPVFYIALYDPKSELFELPYIYENGAVSAIPPQPMGRGLTSLVIQSRQPLLLRTAEEGHARGALVDGAMARSYIGVPIIVRDETIGVLSVQDSENPNAFTEADVRLLSTIAAQIGVGVQNVRLFQQAQRRGDQLAAAAEVSRASTSQLNPDELIVEAAELIQNRFDLYYAAIFLVDEENKWAVLRYATGEAGQQLLARGHRLEVGGNSMVGAAVSTNKARIALDVGKESVRFNNPLLPLTRSEMALPLSVGERVLGALDVQSTQINAFSEADITVLQTIADQIAISLRNAELIRNTQSTLRQLERERHLLQTLLDNVPDRIYFKDRASKYIRLSKTMAAQFGATPEEMIGKWDFDFSKSERVQQAYDEEQQMLKSEQPVIDKLERETRPGEPQTWLFTTKLLLHDADGQVIGSFGISRDVTELKVAQEAAQRRAQQLAAATEVSRASISLLNPDELIVKVAELIRERFDLYYAAIFLVDGENKWAVLRYATGEAGQQLLARGHRLEVGGKSMVGAAIATRQARIALDVGQEPVRFNNPFLPLTHSEMALPLIVGESVFGALDVQSTEVNAFSEADISVLQTMTDQIAIALQNARLYRETQRRSQLEQRINRLTRQIRRSIDPDVIISTTISELSDALGAKRVAAKLGPADQLASTASAGQSRQDRQDGGNGHQKEGAS
jgi:PAS domain S-box-containing protein